ncbi:MAG TPA: hypothetical protein DGK91_10975 [Clostridium sp.]|nr:hypothetical protein [Clostridium sp.]
MKWPCGQCLIVAKHPYGHYYGICDGCAELEEYEAWAEKQEIKKLLNIVLQKANKKKENKD